MRVVFRMTRSQTISALGGLALGAAALSLVQRTRHALDLRGRVALITGGSRGLGLLLARELGRRGARIAIVARKEDELARAEADLRSRNIEVWSAVADVSLEDDAARVVADVVSRYGQLDILVNNAGVIKVGPFEHMTDADFQEGMGVHFWGPLHTIQAAIPHMRSRGAGRLVNISSIGGKLGVPHLVPYCVSKFALTGLSTSLRAELARDGILVTTVCPGLMRTGSPFNAWFKGRHREEFAWFAISGSLPGLTISAERAARQIVDAMRRGDAELVITWPAKLAVKAAAMLPHLVSSAMGLVNRMLLPLPAEHGGNRSYSGWQSGSRLAPSRLTRLTEAAAIANNELPRAPGLRS